MLWMHLQYRTRPAVGSEGNHCKPLFSRAFKTVDPNTQLHPTTPPWERLSRTPMRKRTDEVHSHRGAVPVQQIASGDFVARRPRSSARTCASDCLVNAPGPREDKFRSKNGMLFACHDLGFGNSPGNLKPLRSTARIPAQQLYQRIPKSAQGYIATA